MLELYELYSIPASRNRTVHCNRDFIDFTFTLDVPPIVPLLLAGMAGGVYGVIAVRYGVGLRAVIIKSLHLGLSPFRLPSHSPSLSALAFPTLPSLLVFPPFLLAYTLRQCTLNTRFPTFPPTHDCTEGYTHI